MTWAPGPVVTRRRLGGELKRLREQSRLKLEDVARRLECSPSKISRLENGKGLPRWRDVRDLLDVYDVDRGETYDRLLEWARTGQAPMWWRDYADALTQGMDTYVELEWDASRLCAYESHVVHGLLQTSEYARSILDGPWSPTNRVNRERLLEVRRMRQQVLSAEHGLEFRCVLDESVLYRTVSSPDVMVRQIEHLIEVAEAGHIDIRILPFTAGPLGAHIDSFAKLEFSEGLEHGAVHVERGGGAALFEFDPAEIHTYEAHMAKLLHEALSEERSVPVMKEAVKRHER